MLFPESNEFYLIMHVTKINCSWLYCNCIICGLAGIIMDLVRARALAHSFWQCVASQQYAYDSMHMWNVCMGTVALCRRHIIEVVLWLGKQFCFASDFVHEKCISATSMQIAWIECVYFIGISHFSFLQSVDWTLRQNTSARLRSSPAIKRNRFACLLSSCAQQQIEHLFCIWSIEWEKNLFMMW